MGKIKYFKTKAEFESVKNSLPANSVCYIKELCKTVYTGGLPKNAIRYVSTGEIYVSGAISTELRGSKYVVTFAEDVESIEADICTAMSYVALHNVSGAVRFGGKPSTGIVDVYGVTDGVVSESILDEFVGWELYINGEHIGTITPKAEGGYYYEENTPPIPENAIFKGDDRILGDWFDAFPGVWQLKFDQTVIDKYSPVPTKVYTNWHPEGEPNARYGWWEQGASILIGGDHVNNETFEWIAFE